MNKPSQASMTKPGRGVAHRSAPLELGVAEVLLLEPVAVLLPVLSAEVEIDPDIDVRGAVNDVCCNDADAMPDRLTGDEVIIEVKVEEVMEIGPPGLVEVIVEEAGDIGPPGFVEVTVDEAADIGPPGFIEVVVEAADIGPPGFVVPEDVETQRRRGTPYKSVLPVLNVMGEAHVGDETHP